MTDLRPRRSVLYMPAANPRALEKAKTIPADALIFDLEDAVAPEAKADARAAAVAATASGAYGRRELTIRCNGLDSPWGADDLGAMADAGPALAAVVIPKVDSVSDLDGVSATLDAGGAAPEVSIWAMVETPTAILDARLLAAHPRVEVLVMGTNDLAKELYATVGPNRAGLHPHLAAAVLAARAAGTVILDGVYNDIGDAEGLAAECEQGLQLGFDGKTLIHPGQVQIANDTWAPSAEAIEEAEAVIAAFADAQAEGRGVITVNGRMIEHLHVEQARRTLSVAAAIDEQSDG